MQKHGGMEVYRPKTTGYYAWSNIYFWIYSILNTTPLRLLFR